MRAALSQCVESEQFERIGQRGGCFVGGMNTGEIHFLNTCKIKPSHKAKTFGSKLPCQKS